MKTTRSFAFLGSFLAFATLFLLSGFRVNAQSANSQPPNAAQATTVPARITQAIDETQLVPIKGTHPLARPEFDRGVVPDSTPMNRMLLLLQRSPDQEAALQKLMLDQMSKSSPNFHNWLTPAQFGAQFGPADADVQTVTNWLGGHGFHDIKVATGRLTIEFSGDVGLVRNTFHTDIHHFFVNGEMRQANVSAPMIPAALTPVVAGIVSLNNFPKQSMRHTAGTFSGTRNGKGIPQLTGPPNCGTTGNPACSFFGVGPADFAAIYDIPSTLTGAGSKVAIVGFSDIDPNDVQSFRTLFGLPNNPPVIVHNGPAPGISGPTGEEGEADLDVEWSGAVAPMAEIDFVVSEGTLTADPLELSSLYVVDNNTDDIMSLSFGSCELNLAQTGENVFFDGVWEQAAAQGISVFVSAGDQGSAGCDDFNTEALATNGLAVNGIASTPFNVAVGGTDFDDVGNQTPTFWNTTNAAGTQQSVIGYIPERAWNNSCAATATSGTLNSVCAGAAANGIVAGAGGPSTCGNVNSTTGACISGYAKPPWQTGTGVPADGVRDLPDVSLFASAGSQSDSFYAVCEADAGSSCSSTGQFSVLVVGGTSASSPSFAGILALIEQSERTRVPGSSGRQGNANFVFYKIAQTAANVCSSSSRTSPTTGPGTCVFNDVTKGNNSVPCAANSPAGSSPNCSSTTSGTNGVLVEPSQTTTPAWTTTTGYDLATGLGSVNVANLATAWGTAVGAFNPTITSTKVNGGTSQVTITHGTTVTLAATVAPQSGSGTPSGDVSFIVPTTVTNGVPTTPNSGLGPATLSGGTATLTAPSTIAFALPGGSYNLKAHYAGDGTFAPSDDATGVPVTVTKENSGLLYEIITFDSLGNILNPNATAVTYGSAYILRMDILNHTGTASTCQPLVQNGASAGCAFDATGAVTITDSVNGGAANPLPGGPFSINSFGHAEDQPIQLPGGTNALSATYSGDVSYNAVTTAVTDTITVTPAATTNVLTPAANPVQANQATTLTVLLSTNSFSAQGPTGNVTFKDGTTTIGTASAVQAGATTTAFASATATLSTTFTTLGTHSLTAAYAGDGNYSASTSTAVTVTVTSPGSFTFSSTALTLNSMTGASASSTITLTPTGGFTGSVVVTAGTLPPGVTCPNSPLTINVTGTTAVTGTLNCQVTASSSTMSAANVTETQVYEARATPVAPSTAGGNKTGAKGWWALSAGTGFAALLLIFLPGGRKRLHAALGLGLVCLLSFTLGCGGYGGGGGGNLTPTMTSVTVNADREPSGTAFSFAVTVTGGTPAGMAQLFDGPTPIATAGASATVSGGKATLTTSSLAVGTHAISVHYLGDAYTMPSQSGSLNLTATGSTTIAITTNPAATPAASAINVTVN